LAWVSASFLLNGKRATVIGFGEFPEKRAVFSIYFDALRQVLDLTILERLAERLRAIPGTRDYYADLEAREYRRRPNLPDRSYSYPAQCGRRT
jgi:hypothetical protein